MATITATDYESLAELRHEIRVFLRFSEKAARGVGLEPRQHQLLLTLKGLPREVRPCIGELAERLQVQHHSTVEMVDRLGAKGFVKRQRGGTDRREVLVTLTPKGEKTLRELALQHRQELLTAGPALLNALRHAIDQGTHTQDTQARSGGKKQPW